MNLNDVPWGSRPIGDMEVIGFDELGRPAYRNALTGAEFMLDNALPGNALSRWQDAQPDYMGRDGMNADGSRATMQGGTNSLADFGRDIGNAMLEGFTAPGRAARGETVTNADAWATALDYGVLGAPMAAPNGALRANSFRAYHGSPHDFDRFSMDKIGTGEGAQAYGHGLYFAENEGVARSYRDDLSRGISVDGQHHQFGADAGEAAEAAILKAGLPAEIAEEALWYINRGYSPGQLIDDIAKKDPAMADRVRPILAESDRGGSMYEVNINADPDRFLDWDAPLSQQPQGVREALEAFDPDMYSPMGNDYDAAELGQSVYQRLAAHKRDYGIDSGRTDLTTLGGAQAGATDDLRTFGIPGIKYLDQGSRSAVDVNELRGTVSMWEKAVSKTPNDAYAVKMLDDAKAQLAQAEAPLSSNFVVFDENIISIIRKYGVAGAAPMLGLTAAELQDQIDAQGGGI